MNEAAAFFGQISDEYALARPRYPSVLFDWLVSKCVSTEAAWDCATGNGQAAVDLAASFRVVYATDISAEQIAKAVPCRNVIYSVQTAEETCLPDNSVDLICVAQSLHWFDFPRFWPGVFRVSRRDAIFAAWGYDWLFVSPKVDVEVIQPFREIIKPFWAPNNRILWSGYRDEDIQFPLFRIETPPFFISMKWTLHRILAYMQTWSAYKRSLAEPLAAAKMDSLMERTRAAFDSDEEMDVRMPLKMVVGRIEKRN